MTGPIEHLSIPINRRLRASFPTLSRGNIRHSHRSPLKEETVMSTFREKAQGRTKQMVGQMIGDEKLVEEGTEQEREAEQQSKSADTKSADTKSAHIKAADAKSDTKSADAKSSGDRSGRASRH